MDISYTTVRRGEYAGVQDGHYIGRVVGDYATGFEALPLDGRRFMSVVPFASVEAAFEALALEFAFHYGEATVAA